MFPLQFGEHRYLWEDRRRHLPACRRFQPHLSGPVRHCRAWPFWRRKSVPASPPQTPLGQSEGHLCPAREGRVQTRGRRAGWSSRREMHMSTQVPGPCCMADPTAPRKSSIPQLFPSTWTVGRHRIVHHPVANGPRQPDRVGFGHCPSAITLFPVSLTEHHPGNRRHRDTFNWRCCALIISHLSQHHPENKGSASGD